MPKVRLSSAIALVAIASLSAVARADGPGVGTPYVVSLGDSYISGESGRWAGNTANGEQYVDALGSSAYLDGGSSEVIPNCHRARVRASMFSLGHRACRRTRGAPGNPPPLVDSRSRA